MIIMMMVTMMMVTMMTIPNKRVDDIRLFFGFGIF